MAYGPGTASKRNLEGLCADMTAVVMRTYELTEVDFSVIESRRSVAQQRGNVMKKVSWTMDSDHLKEDEDGTGVLAVDLYPWVDGKTSFHKIPIKLLAKAVFRAAGELGVQIKWGGGSGPANVPTSPILPRGGEHD